MNGPQCLIRLHDRPARRITIVSFEPEPLRPGDYPRALAGVLALAAARHLRARGATIRIRAP